MVSRPKPHRALLIGSFLQWATLHSEPERAAQQRPVPFGHDTILSDADAATALIVAAVQRP
jgi:hypothetical protein